MLTAYPHSAAALSCAVCIHTAAVRHLFCMFGKRRRTHLFVRSRGRITMLKGINPWFACRTPSVPTSSWAGHARVNVMRSTAASDGSSVGRQRRAL